MANINFPTRTPRGVITPNQTVPPEGAITIRVNAVAGTGANGGGTNQRGYPDIVAMSSAGNVLDIYATLYAVADMAFGPANGQPIPMKLTMSIPPYNAGETPAYYDLIFDPLGTDKLPVMQHYEFMLKATLPVVWQTIPPTGGYSES